MLIAKSKGGYIKCYVSKNRDRPSFFLELEKPPTDRTAFPGVLANFWAVTGKNIFNAMAK